MKTDPIGYANGINWYAYVGNDPINRRDPSGLADNQSEQECQENCGTTFTGGPRDGKGQARVVDKVTPESDGRGGVGYYSTSDGGKTATWVSVSANAASFTISSGRTSGGASKGGSASQNNGGADIVVTADCRGTCPDKKYYVAGGRYILNPNYVDPAPWLNLKNAIVVPPLIGASAGIAVSTEALFMGGRIGVLNSNSFFRVGWGPGVNATRSNFYQQFRFVIGSEGARIHKHFDIPGLIK